MSGEPRMRDQNTRATLIEAVIAGGLIAVGIPTGHLLGPLAVAATSVGCNWTHSLAERGFHHWSDRWFTDDGVLNRDIAKALCHALADAVRQVEQDWRQCSSYRRLQIVNKEEAQQTLTALSILRDEEADYFLLRLQQEQLAKSFLYEDEFEANEAFKQTLHQFLSDYSIEFVTFVTEQLGPQWILRFLEILKDPGEEGTRAWRACQLLWQKSLMLGIEQIEQTTAETADTVRWLQEWARQLKSLPPTQRNTIGQDALEEILHSVQAQLDEMQITLDKTYATTLDIKARLEQIYPKGVPAEMTPFQVWNIPYPRNPVFTGREELLERLARSRRSGQTMAISQAQAISGLGGIGKTQLAVEYAYRFHQDYQAVLWARADSREALISAFVAIAELLKLPEKDAQEQMITVNAVKAWMKTHMGWLLILDNADDLTIIPEFLPPTHGGHVLLTTRAQAVGVLTQSVEVEKMGMVEGTLLLLRRTNILKEDVFLDQASEEQLAGAEAILIEMDFLPLALDQAGAYIEETRCGLFAYLDLYRTHRKELLQRRGSLPSDHPEPVATTWSLSFQKVEQHNRAAAELLRFCAFLDPDVIPEELISEGSAHVGQILHHVATDVYALNEAIEQLLKFSLIQRNVERKTLSIHRLVQAVLQDAMKPRVRRQWAERAVRAINAVFPGDPQDLAAWPQCLRYLDQAQACHTLIEHYGLAFVEAASVLNRTGVYLKDHALYAIAEPLYQRALAIWEKQLGPEHPDTAQSLNNLAKLYWAQGKYELSEPLYQRALAIYEQQLGPEHSYTATSLNNLANLYWQQGKYTEAEPLYQRALAILEKQLGPEHPDTAMSLNNLAELYRAQGKYELAEPLYQRALAIREKQLGPEHPNTVATRKNYHTLVENMKRKEKEQH